MGGTKQVCFHLQSITLFWKIQIYFLHLLFMDAIQTTLLYIRIEWSVVIAVYDAN
jgi:hypothetical protein